MVTFENENDKINTTYQKAKDQVRALKSFYFSLMLYTIVNTGLIYIWYEYSGQGFQWFWFPLIGWGLGLLFKGLAAYDINFMFGRHWEERKMKQYIGKEKQSYDISVDRSEAYQNARKKVDSIKGFYSHLGVYLIVNSFIVTAIVWNTGIHLFSFAALSTPFFWGIGLASHALGVFGEDLFFGKNWEERKLKELMDKE